MRADLHTHSTVSDGTETPAVVMRQAAAAGLDVVALTDHDSSAGWDDAARVATEVGLTLLRGTEFSARHQGITVHMLGYLHDPSYPPLVDAVERARQSRAQRAKIMVAKVGADFPITWDDVVAQTGPGAVVGRPHIADALVKAGVVADRTAAFAAILHNGSPYYVRHYAPEAMDMVGLIRAAGGVPVFAHPGAVFRQKILDNAAIGQLAHAGLAGLEVYHRDNPPEQRERLLGLAQRYGLLVTGASDYHGTGKPNRLGEHLTDAATCREIISQGFLPPVGPVR
jgi:predicted metal-dependent phosphoesterase TrpH